MDNVEFYHSKLWIIVDILISSWIIFYFLLDKNIYTDGFQCRSAARIRSPPWCDLESDHFLQPLLSLENSICSNFFWYVCRMYHVCTCISISDTYIYIYLYIFYIHTYVRTYVYVYIYIFYIHTCMHASIHYITLHCIALHCTALHCIALHVYIYILCICVYVYVCMYICVCMCIRI